MFKNKTRLGNKFRFKDQIPKYLTSGELRHLNVKTAEHIGTLPLSKKQVNPKNRSVADHLPFRNHSASYDDFRNLARENKKFLLELNESLLIMRDKPSLNRNITLAPLYLFGRALL